MKINKKYIIIFGLVVFVVLIFLFLILKSNKPEEIIELKNSTFTTSDNRVTITAKEDFKKKNVSNYDLYLTKNDKQIVGLFTYNLNEYEEKNSKEILDKQIEYFTSTRKDFKLFKKEKIIDLDDKKITKVEYSGTNTDSSDCVYIFAVIDFKSDPNYVVYSNEVILHKDYESNISEMLDILKNAKLNREISFYEIFFF